MYTYPKYFLVYRNRLRELYPFLNQNPTNEPSNQNEFAIQNEIRRPKQLEATEGPPIPSNQNGSDPRAPFPSRAPTPLYGMRIRTRTYSSCIKNEALCDSLPVVDCGGERFRYNRISFIIRLNFCNLTTMHKITDKYHFI